jgi:hypothetical protein
MKKPLVISIGLFLFLFGLAVAKASKSEAPPRIYRIPANISAE